MAHAAIQFTLEWPQMTRDWNSASNNVVIIGVPDEGALGTIDARSVEEGIAATVVREPDLGDSVCAVALQPGIEARRICANMPLAGRVLVPG